MSNDIFPLQPVLSVKENLLEELRVQLSKLLAAHVEATAQLEALQGERKRSDVALAAARGRGILRMDDIRQLEAYIEHLDQAIVRQKHVIAELDVQVNAMRDQVGEAHKEVKMLNKLKERAVKARAHEVAIAETKMNDELAVAQFYRRRDLETQSEKQGA
jgi:flagellar FliJ protein